MLIHKRKMTILAWVVDGKKTPRWAVGGIDPPRPWGVEMRVSPRDPTPPIRVKAQDIRVKPQDIRVKPQDIRVI